MVSSSRTLQPAAVDRAAKGVILAIDYGSKRFGLALSDELGTIARPFEIWNRTNRRRDLTRLRELVRERAVRQIVVGLPVHLDGTPSEMSDEAKAFAARLGKALGIPVEMVDERLSSWEAEQVVTASRRHPHNSSTKRKATLDDVAAAVILRDYLNRTLPETGPRN